MIAAIRESFSSTDCTFTTPMGGMFIFLTFPTLRMTSFELFEQLAKRELICVSGDEFLVPNASMAIATEDGKPGNPEPPKLLPTIRVTYAAAQPEQIRKGIKMLSDCVHELLEKQNK
jgi:DNA-binding transcriptional MocR family regulator